MPHVSDDEVERLIREKEARDRERERRLAEDSPRPDVSGTDYDPSNQDRAVGAVAGILPPEEAWELLAKLPLPLSVGDVLKMYTSLERTLSIASGVRRRLRASGHRFEQFRAEWKVFRMLIPLQLRLFMEQAFYEVGSPWREAFVTGFGPVGGVPAGTYAGGGEPTTTFNGQTGESSSSGEGGKDAGKKKKGRGDSRKGLYEI